MEDFHLSPNDGGKYGLAFDLYAFTVFSVGIPCCCTGFACTSTDTRSNNANRPVLPYQLRDTGTDLPEATFSEIFTIVNTVSGECQNESLILTWRQDTITCVDTDSQTYDPCFARNNTFDEYVCLSAPWETNAVAFTPTNVASSALSSFYEPLDINTTLPWGLELANGKQCILIQSPIFDRVIIQFNGLPATYDCGELTYIIGDLDRSNLAWRAFYYQAPPFAQQIPITRVWF
ncbi:MAG: hypothetical protein HC828_05260 [Blastochloris sp.]|nr:hypothetical protein [Blastochloris sp.]